MRPFAGVQIQPDKGPLLIGLFEEKRLAAVSYSGASANVGTGKANKQAGQPVFFASSF